MYISTAPKCMYDTVLTRSHPACNLVLLPLLGGRSFLPPSCLCLRLLRFLQCIHDLGLLRFLDLFLFIIPALSELVDTGIVDLVLPFLVEVYEEYDIVTKRCKTM